MQFFGLKKKDKIFGLKLYFFTRFRSLCGDSIQEVELKSVIQSFGRMSKKYQDEYLKLYNANNDIGSVEVQDSDKRIYFLLR